MTTRERLARHLPVFALEVRTPRLTMRYPDDDDLVTLAELAARGVHDPDRMPFSIPWTAVPSPYQERNTLAFFWDQRPTVQRDEWHVPLVILVDDEIVGTQGLFGKAWSVTKAFETGSWLGRDWHGRGIGKEMRAGALHLGFDGFGADEARTAAFADNPSSLGVTRSLGYQDAGAERTARGGEVAVMNRFSLLRTEWEQTRRDDIEVIGAADVAAMFGTERAPGMGGPVQS